MKQLLLILFFVLGVSYASYSQQTAVKGEKATTASPSEARHFVTLVIGNILYFSLEDNPNSSVSAQKQLIVNSNIPFNVVVNENYSEPSFSYIPNADLADEEHGPAVSQLTSVKRIKYFRDCDGVRLLTALLYTAAPL